MRLQLFHPYTTSIPYDRVAELIADAEPSQTIRRPA